MIRKKGKKYVLSSKKTGRTLGTYATKKAAKKREQQVNFFKHKRKK